MSLYDINGDVISETVGITKPYIGKKWAVLGDSISMSHATNYYHTLIAEKLGFTVTNLASSGKGYAYIRDTATPNIPSDVDLITIFAGTNDMTSGSNVGNASDTTDTFSGTVYQTILAIQERFPSVPIGVITPTPRYDSAQYTNWVINIAKGIKAVCEFRSIPCLDLNTTSGLLGLTVENKAYYFDGDSLHLNDAGHSVIASKIEPFIKSIMPAKLL